MRKIKITASEMAVAMGIRLPVVHRRIEEWLVKSHRLPNLSKASLKTLGMNTITIEGVKTYKMDVTHVLELSDYFDKRHRHKLLLMLVEKQVVWLGREVVPVPQGIRHKP